MHKEWFKPGRQLRLAITCTSLTAFVLFGYDQGVFGGLVTNPDFLGTFGNPEAAFLGIIVSIYNVGCFVGCALNFYFGARFGRRDAIWMAMCCVSVGAVTQCSAYSVPQMMVGRFITGLGVGIDTSTVPMYQAELCKADVRGRLVTTEVFFVALGVSSAYFMDYGFSFIEGPAAWRVPIALQIPMAMGVAVLVVGLPETPRWLWQQGRKDEAVAVMVKVHDVPETDAYVLQESEEIAKAIEIESNSPFKWSRIFQRDALQTGYRVGLACLVLFMNQWAGINVVVFYISPVLENSVGLERNTAIIAGGCINLAFAAGSLLPALGVDHLGRRKPMMFGSLGMGLSMMMVAILLSFNGTDKERVTANASIAFFVTFMISFGMSLNSIPWLYSVEVLPLKVRAQGTALSVFNNWIWVFLIVMVTPTLVQNLQWKTYLIFMAMNFAFIPAIYFLFPETKGLRGVGIWKWATSETQGCSLFDAFIAHRDRGNEDSLLQIDYLFLKDDRLQPEVRRSVSEGMKEIKNQHLEQRSDEES